MPVLVAMLLVIGALPDHRLAARLWIQAGDTARGLYRALESVSPRTERARAVLVVNPPDALVERGIGAIVFRNGLLQIKELAAHPDTRYDFGELPLDDKLPIRLGTPPLATDVLRARVRDPTWAVFICQRPPRLIRPVTTANVDQVIAGQ